MLYDMSDIDQIFDDMESKVGGGLSILGNSLGSLMINLGMIAVILASAFMWLKLNSYETKNS
jgi:hypothetical protein